MTIVIDDGTFTVGNSFVTLAEADTYSEDRNNTTWIYGDEPEKEAALIRAFDYLSVQNWISTTFDDEIPTKIEQAQMLGAGKEFDSPGVLQPDVATGIKSEELKDVIETHYFEGGTGTIFSSVVNLITPYINRPGYVTRIVRGGGGT